MLVTERTGDVNVVGGGAATRSASPADVVSQRRGRDDGPRRRPRLRHANRCIYTCYMTAGDVRVVRFTVGAGYSSLDEPARR